jgi:hypothetical protein
LSSSCWLALVLRFNLPQFRQTTMQSTAYCHKFISLFGIPTTEICGLKIVPATANESRPGCFPAPGLQKALCWEDLNIHGDQTLLSCGGDDDLQSEIRPMCRPSRGNDWFLRASRRRGRQGRCEIGQCKVSGLGPSADTTIRRDKYLLRDLEVPGNLVVPCISTPVPLLVMTVA